MRRVPAALQAALQAGTVTPCRLLRFTLASGEVFGLTTLDRPVFYGGVLYSAAGGFDSSVIATDLGLSVDNGEATSLLSAEVPGITLERVARGDLDDAAWQMLLIDWQHPEYGDVLLDAGDVGEVRVVDDLIYIPELLSYTIRLRQPIGSAWSRRCRAEFGTPAAGQTGCGVDAEALWQTAAVTGVDPDDPRRTFSATGLIGETLPTAMVQWLSGLNAGSRKHRAEAFGEASGTVALFDALVFPVQLGDTFRIRRDCNKSPSDCTFYSNFLNYKGEPYIPVGDGLETMTPSAQTFGGVSGSAIAD